MMNRIRNLPHRVEIWAKQSEGVWTYDRTVRARLSPASADIRATPWGIEQKIEMTARIEDDGGNQMIPGDSRIVVRSAPRYMVGVYVVAGIFQHGRTLRIDCARLPLEVPDL